MPNIQSTRPRRTRKPSGTGPLWLCAAIALCLCAALIAAYHSHGPQRRIEIGDAISVTPTATPKPLSLTVALPDLDQDQAYWFEKAKVVPSCPMCAGISEPAIALNDNALAAWLALIWTESRYDPWAVSSIGCFGLGQLCFSLDTPETRARPEYNLYVSAREFARLLDANGGDLGETLRNYKGVSTNDTEWEANTVYSVIRVAP